MLNRIFRRQALPAAKPEAQPATKAAQAKRTVTIDLDAPDPDACKEVFRAAGKLWGRSRPSSAATAEAPARKAGRPRKVIPVPAPVEVAPPADSTAK